MNEFRKGWPTLLGAFLGVATGVSSLLFYSQGLFLKPLAMELGWSRGAASLGPLVGTLAAAIAAPMAGRIMDRIGPARLGLVSMALLALGFAALGWFTSGLGIFLLITGLVSSVAVGSSPLSYSHLLVSSFDRHRGLALGLALAGTGIGTSILPVFLGPLIADHGWRAGYFVLAVVVAIALVPVGLLLKDGPRGGSSRESMTPLSSVMGQTEFRLLGAIFLLAAVGVLGTVVHFPAMLSDEGLSPARVGALAGTIGLAVIAGRATAGLLLDRIPAHLVTAGFFGLTAAGIGLLALGGPTYGLVGALALGLSVGAEVDLIAYLVSRLFDRKIYGTTYGGVYALFLVGGAIGPALIGFLFDVTGNYRIPLLVAATSLIVYRRSPASSVPIKRAGPEDGLRMRASPAIA